MEKINNENNKITKSEVKGRISEIQKNSYIISYLGKDIPAKLKGCFRGEEADKLPVVGDYVIFLLQPSGGFGHRICLHQNKLLT